MYGYLTTNQKKFYNLVPENQPDNDLIEALIDKVEQLTEVVMFNITMCAGKDVGQQRVKN